MYQKFAFVNAPNACIRIQRQFNSNMIQRVAKFLGLRKPAALGKAKSLFYNCKNQAELPFWYSAGRIGKDFRSKQTMIVLHVWMVHKRLINEGKEGLLVQEALFDELWEDTSNRIRGQGITEISVNKYLSQVQGYSFRCCVELDHIMSIAAANSKLLTDSTGGESKTLEKRKFEGGEVDDRPDPKNLEEVEAQLLDDIGGVLWRFAFLRKEEIQADHVMLFAQYLRKEQQSLQNLPQEAVLQGLFKWGALPAWKPVEKKHQSRKIPKDDTVGEWKEAIAADGRTYYWNTASRESRWDKPN